MEEKYIQFDEPKEYNPKRVNRFCIELPSDFNIPNWSIKKANKPKYNFITGSWEPIYIDFYDPIEPSVSKSLQNLIYRFKNQDNIEGKIFDFKILSLDSTGLIVEEWSISVDYIDYIRFGDLNVNSDSIQSPSIKLIPIDCILI